MSTAASIAEVAYTALIGRGKTELPDGPPLSDIVKAVANAAQLLDMNDRDNELQAVQKIVRERRWAKGAKVYVNPPRSLAAAGRRITEKEISETVVLILEELPAHRATWAELFHEVPRRIKLSIADQVQLPSRKAEALWMQQIRNIVAHKTTPSNFVFERLLVEIDQGVALPGYGDVEEPKPVKRASARRKAAPPKKSAKPAPKRKAAVAAKRKPVPEKRRARR
jgi:hypothetical protein